MKNKITAGLLALFFGSLGIHRFYLNQQGLGILYIILSLATCGVFAIVPVIESLIFFFMNDYDFNQKYNKPFLMEQQQQQLHVHLHTQDGRVSTSNPIPRTEKRRAEEMRRKAPKGKGQPRRPEPRPILKSKPNPEKIKGIRYFKEYDFRRAKEAFNKALEVEYDDIATHFNLACCYSMDEDVDKSLFHLNKSVELGFNQFDRIKQHDSLAYLRSHDEYLEFVANGYKWNPKTGKSNIPNATDTPNTDLLDNGNDDDFLDLDSPQKEKILITETIKPGEAESSMHGMEDIFDDLFGDMDDESPNAPPTPITTSPAPNPAPPPPSGGLTKEVMAQLKQLAELRHMGVLTQEEFEVQKRRLLK